MRALLRRRYVAPLVAAAVVVTVLALVQLGECRATLELEAFPAPVARQGDDTGLIRVPPALLVGSYEWRAGVFGGAESRGYLEGFYGAARVVGTRVTVAKPSPRTDHEPPDEADLGGSADEEGTPHPDVERAIEAWMTGSHGSPLRVTWWTAPPEHTLVLLAIDALLLVVMLGLARPCVRVWFDGVLHVESRGVVRSRTSRLTRTEIRAVTVEARGASVFTFARPVVVTRDGRRVPVGPLAVDPVAAADLAARVRALVA